MSEEKFRLITRSDFDGLVCAVLFKELNMIDDIKFVHPKDMQDGKVDVNIGDITTNLPYVKGVSYAFDHHLSEIERVGVRANHFINPNAPSAARVVWESFGGASVFKNISDEMMHAVDIADSAMYEIDDILNPSGWTLLNFIMDSRTGLGRFRDFRISNYQLMMKLIDLCKNLPIEEILADEDVKERVDLYFDYQDKFKQQVKDSTTIYDNVAYINLLENETIYPGNRFMVYALFPKINISIHAMWRKEKEKVVYAVGKSILNRTSTVDVGSLMLQYGGGGHKAAGTCQIDLAEAEKVKEEIVQALKD